MGIKVEYQAAFVTLAAVNFEEIVQFYARLLAIAPNPYQPEVYAEFSAAGLRLGIFKPKTHHESEFLPQGSGSLSICFEVTNLDDAIAHLGQLGYPPPGEITTASHGREIYAYDPLGNRLIFHQSVEHFLKNESSPEVQ
ncbi:VOC family protein [Phormidium pseudopriestleyi FRX01]|uniref:VOC family protein n=1 Tax=Phormidium pseudopriestleyi FRX01 TaxID=1759528 RepID=A0ABS3FYX9_9CYAN|nr:VOC family protein [Phormidium pseudopriestleyi]MBO0352354.1 VOC family protein [Phormidium pseudopriestleyi FRX01]